MGRDKDRNREKGKKDKGGKKAKGSRKDKVKKDKGKRRGRDRRRSPSPESEYSYVEYTYYSYSESRSPTPKRCDRRGGGRGGGRDASRSRRDGNHKRYDIGSHMPRGGGGGGSRGGPPPRAGGGGGGGGGNRDRDRNGGGYIPTDGPRSPSRDGSPPNDMIYNMLIDREKARVKRDFAEADRIRDELRNRGVDILERERRWQHKDGRSGARPNADDGKRGGGAAEERE